MDIFNKGKLERLNNEVERLNGEIENSDKNINIQKNLFKKKYTRIDLVGTVSIQEIEIHRNYLQVLKFVQVSICQDRNIQRAILNMFVDILNGIQVKENFYSAK